MKEIKLLAFTPNLELYEKYCRYDKYELWTPKGIKFWINDILYYISSGTDFVIKNKTIQGRKHAYIINEISFNAIDVKFDVTTRIDYWDYTPGRDPVFSMTFKPGVMDRELVEYRFMDLFGTVEVIDQYGNIIHENHAEAGAKLDYNLLNLMDTLATEFCVVGRLFSTNVVEFIPELDLIKKKGNSEDYIDKIEEESIEVKNEVRE